MNRQAPVFTNHPAHSSAFFSIYFIQKIPTFNIENVRIIFLPATSQKRTLEYCLYYFHRFIRDETFVGMIGEDGTGFVWLAELNLYFLLYYFRSTYLLVKQEAAVTFGYFMYISHYPSVIYSLV